MIGLEELMIKQKIKTKEIEKQLGVCQGSVASWYRVKIPKKYLKSLTDIFNVEEEYLNKQVNDINTYKPKVKGFQNKYKINEDVTEFYVIKKNGTEVTFQIDTEDLSKLIKLDYSWGATYDEGVDNYYGTSTCYHNNEDGKRVPKTVLLHEVIAGYKYVDHINTDTKDNRKINLRPTSHSPNLRNRKGKNKNNKSGFRNVCLIQNKWQVQLMVEGKNKVLGRFPKDQLEEAVIFAEEMRQKYYGEWAGKGEKYEER